MGLLVCSRLAVPRLTPRRAAHQLLEDALAHVEAARRAAVLSGLTALLEKSCNSKTIRTEAAASTRSGDSSKLVLELGARLGPLGFSEGFVGDFGAVLRTMDWEAG
eukprot:SAG11_NODE_3162_length_2642_cov_2.016516_3_plen_106_part_00